ncbi:hypothetical protein BKH43_05140 [Helicobacter sp. 13S00401-1]|uniref:F0F1 ATP synthase subunit B family protein n=1 Tax=Helicobacter sp. 13S00401-1 TaxID=1905758 RepID=UPI000BA704DF|nr:hypothetical protein [Helicobacter sp. 13S00401-1]PAF50287.1 hypothetical protein BKH43_05140 [Helicobacter sp. 13S00401-1]
MQIEPNIYVMILVFVVFLITMYLMNKFVFKPMIGFMDKRDEHIRQDLIDAHSNQDEITALERETQDILQKAKHEAHMLIESETKKAKDAANDSIEKALQENKAKLDAFKANLREQKPLLKAKIKEHLLDLDSMLSKKIRNV